MNRTWYDFKALHSNFAGARDAFADACETLFRKKFSSKNVQQVRVKQGDGGIDIYVGELGAEAVSVYQCKFFLDEIEKAQKDQIHNSFKTAIKSKKYDMKDWTLCLPKQLSLDELTWWTDWKKRREEEYGLSDKFIGLYVGNALIDLMREEEVYNAIFKIEDSIKISEIRELLKQQHGVKSNQVIRSNAELSNINDFFSQRGLTINSEVRREVSALMFELAQNAFQHGGATNCRIQVGTDTITLFDNGRPFDPFITGADSSGAGLLYAKHFVSKYNDACQFDYFPRSENETVLNFRQAISGKSIADPCYYCVGHTISRDWSNDWDFDFRKDDIDPTCEVITVELGYYLAAPSIIRAFIYHVYEITQDSSPRIIIKITGNPFLRQFAIKMLERFPAEMRTRIEIY